MKKTLSFALLAAVALGGCVTTGANTTASSANTPMTLEEALQKSAEARQQLMEAKQSYQTVKSAAAASKQNGTDITTELAKQAVEQKIGAVKNQINAEKQAWKDVLKD